MAKLIKSYNTKWKARFNKSYAQSVWPSLGGRPRSPAAIHSAFPAFSTPPANTETVPSADSTSHRKTPITQYPCQNTQRPHNFRLHLMPQKSAEKHPRQGKTWEYSYRVQGGTIVAGWYHDWVADAALQSNQCHFLAAEQFLNRPHGTLCCTPRSPFQ